MIIDFQHHFTPRSLYHGPEKIVGKLQAQFRGDGNPAHTPNPLLVDLDAHIAMMDEAGVDAAVLSSPPGFDSDLATCRTINDAAAEAVRSYPGRFIGQAHVPALGGKEALAEMARCREELGFPGVVITSEPQRQPLDSEALEPFWREACRRDMYVFVHPPLGALTYDMLNVYDLQRSIGREFSLMTATIRLINGGVLDRFPELRLQMAHLGGGIAALMGRIRGYQDRGFYGVEDHPVHGRLPDKPFDEYLRERIFFDTAGVCGEPKAVRAALLEIPATQVVFGTDYPQEIRDPAIIRAFIEGIRSIERGGEAVLSGNVSRLVAGDVAPSRGPAQKR